MKKIRLMIISHTFVQPQAQSRWRKFASHHKEFHVQLISPRQWNQKGWSVKVSFKDIDEMKKGEDNFEIKTVNTTSHENTEYYLICNFQSVLKEFEPDVVYCIGANFALLQTILYRRIWAPKTQLFFFTNAGIDPQKPKWTTIKIRYVHAFLLKHFSWWLIRKGTDGGFCHYPAAAKRLKQDGFSKPLVVQTQVGVDEDIFNPYINDRKNTRKSIGLKGFTIGYAGRITKEKGILDIAAAVNEMPNDVQFLVIGDGPARNELEKFAIKKGWKNRLHLTGHVPYYEVAKYMRAMDCFVIGSKTIPGWVDSFPLVVAQAMATSLPVIGSSNGAIPYQLNNLGLLFPEGDVSAIIEHLNILYADKNRCAQMGANLYSRSFEEFCVTSINNKLNKIFQSYQKTNNLNN